MSSDKDQRDKDIEDLKKERDLLLLKDEINKLKRNKKIKTEVKEKSKKYIKIFLSVLIYISATYGVLLLMISEKNIGLIFTGVFLVTPLLIKLIRGAYFNYLEEKSKEDVV